MGRLTRLRRDLNNGLRYSAEVCCVAAAIFPCVLLRIASTHEYVSIRGQRNGNDEKVPGRSFIDCSHSFNTRCVDQFLSKTTL